MNDFRDFCGLFGVVGTMEGTHVHVRKSYMGPKDYFYFKSSSKFR
jgi:hypothetical protein